MKILCLLIEENLARREGTLCASQRRDPYRGRAGFEQSHCGGARRRSRGENVVNQQNVLLGDGFRMGNRERAADIQAPLAGRKSGLASRGPQPHERSIGESEPPRRMTRREKLKRMLREQAGLIEAALGQLGSMQRNRNDQHLERRVAVESADGLCQHAAQLP